MARYYRRRYTRVVKPKKKWASNMRDIIVGATGGIAKIGLFKELCVNGLETTGTGTGQTALPPTPTIIKAGNFKVQCDVALSTSVGSLVSTFLYVMYIPEGVFVSAGISSDYDLLNGLVNRHPEWVLAWRQVSSDLVTNQANLDRVSFSSRLKRNLNSGDAIYLLFLAYSSDGNITKYDVRGKVQFWTCAN